jgi:hypothetical protein
MNETYRLDCYGCSKRVEIPLRAFGDVRAPEGLKATRENPHLRCTNVLHIFLSNLRNWLG